MMNKINNQLKMPNQHGFGLAETLVAMVIGLLVALVIAQVSTRFEGQKRSTGGSADAQTNGALALYAMQRQLQEAGFGLPFYSEVYRPLSCANIPTVDHDSDSATPAIDMFPVTIVDGGTAAGVSDTLVVHSNGAAKQNVTAAAASVPNGGSHDARGGAPTRITSVNVTTKKVTVDNNFGCKNKITIGAKTYKDIALVMPSDPALNCSVATVEDLPNNVDITLSNVSGISVGQGLSCLGELQEYRYNVVGNELFENGLQVAEGIVNMRMQYGISATANDNQISTWVNARGARWGYASGVTPSIDDRKLIKAIRVVVVARNGVMEKTAAETGTTLCSSVTAANPTGLCAWEGSVANPAPTIDLRGDANWNRYRYRVYETIIPMRNIIWNRSRL